MEERGLFHFEKALQLRREKKFPEARAELELACDEGNLDALNFRTCALKFGGFGYKRNLKKFREQSNASLFESDTVDVSLLANVIGTVARGEYEILSIITAQRAFKPEYIPILELYTERNSGWAKCLLGSDRNKLISNQERLAYLMDACEEEVSLAYRELGKLYEPSDPCKAARYFIMYGNLSLLNIKIKECTDLKVLYIYGEYIDRIGTNKYQETFDLARGIYVITNDKAERASLYFIWMCQTNGFLCKDIIYEIVKMVWKSRRDPSVWIL